MGSLYKLITKTNLKSPTLAFPLIMPLVFILLYSVGIDPGQDSETVNKLVAGFFVTIFSVTTMQNGLMGFGINFMNIKKSVMLKRIGATELSKMDVILSLLLFGLTLWVISAAWIIICVSMFSALGVFYSADATTALGGLTEGGKATMFGWTQYISWGKVTIATLFMLIPSYALGLFVTSIAKEDQVYMGIAMIYFFFAGFVGGIMFPPTALIPPWMQWFSLLIPHAYVGNFYDWAAGYDVNMMLLKDLSQESALIISGIVSIVFGIVLTGLAAKYLKFD